MPFPINGTITTSTNVSASNCVVYARNETSGERINITADSDGKYILDLSNLASGYLSTDNVTIYCSYQNEYAESTILISDNLHEVNLTLITISDPGATNYCTVSEVWEQLDDATSTDISAKRVVDAIQRAESEIDEYTETKFVSTTVSNEILSWNKGTSWKSYEQLSGSNPIGRVDYTDVSLNDTFRLDKRPLLSITSLEKNSVGENSADSWTSLTEQIGSGGDFMITNLFTSEISFVKNYPRFGKRSLRVSYVYGCESVPKVVNRLTVLLACKEIIISKMHASQFEGADPVSLEGISLGKGISGSSTYLKQLNIEISEAYKLLPRYKSGLV